MAKYLVTSNLRHDGKDYEPGKKVELNDEQAEALVAAGVVAADDSGSGSKKGKDKE